MNVLKVELAKTKYGSANAKFGFGQMQNSSSLRCMAGAVWPGLYGRGCMAGAVWPG